MRTKQLFITLFTLLTVFSFPATAENKLRELPPFSEISLQISGTIYLEQGDIQSVRIEAKEDTEEEIITEVKGRRLIIRFKGNNLLRRSINPGKVDIYITVPGIDALSVTGSGNIKCQPIDSRILDLAVNGSGDIFLSQLNSERVRAVISGSGNISINGGNTNEFAANISGSGNLKAPDFEAVNVDTRLSGSGNCTVHAQKTLKARVSGSGNILYKGNPLIDSAVSGSGRLKKLQ